MLLAPRVALACSCVGAPLADVSWPLDGATDVAIDTPIVVWLYGSDTSRGPSLPTLMASDGVVVPLVETMRMTTPSDVCAASEYLFMRPARPLTPGVRYTIDFPAQAGPSLSPTPVTFQAGHEVFEPEPPVSADLQLLAVYRDPACTEPHCPQLNAARVDLGAPPARMLWLQFHSDAPKYGELNAQFIAQGRPGAQAAIQLPVALSPNDGCIDIRIVGVEGRPLLSERRCQPDRCAVSTRVSVSTCGGLPFSEIDAASVPVDSCKPTGVADAATAATGAGAAASMSQNTPTPTAPSCAATHAGARQCSAWWSMLALGGLRRRLRRPTAKAVRDLASKRMLTLLDMTQFTHAYLERLGEMKAAKLFRQKSWRTSRMPTSAVTWRWPADALAERSTARARRGARRSSL
jgi:hypothetical protein